MAKTGHNRQLGQLGEQLAADFLEQQGWLVIDRNFYTRFGEIDLITQRDDPSAQAGEILFVEVKTRTSIKYGYPEQAVNQRKMKRLLRAISIYRSSRHLKGFWRIDIISIEVDYNTRLANIRWFKNITS